MKIFVVMTERDGKKTREPGKSVTEIERITRRYAAEDIAEVLEELHNLPLESYEETLMAVYEEHPAVTILGLTEARQDLSGT